MIAVAHGPLVNGKQTLAAGLLKRLSPDMLCLADRGFYSYALWNQACASGAELLWRMKSKYLFHYLGDLAAGEAIDGRKHRDMSFQARPEHRG